MLLAAAALVSASLLWRLASALAADSSPSPASGKGPAFYTTGSTDSYLNLKPVTAAASSGSNSAAMVGIVVAVVAAVAIALWLLLRRRRTKAEEV